MMAEGCGQGEISKPRRKAVRVPLFINLKIVNEKEVDEDKK
jgi:hypothetical protein